jgi:hypothetical protein
MEKAMFLNWRRLAVVGVLMVSCAVICFGVGVRVGANAVRRRRSAGMSLDGLRLQALEAVQDLEVARMLREERHGDAIDRLDHGD